MDIQLFETKHLDKVTTYFKTRGLYGPEYVSGDRRRIVQRWLAPLRPDRDFFWLVWDNNRVIGHVSLRFRYHGDDPFDLVSLGLIPEETTTNRLEELLDFVTARHEPSPHANDTLDIYCWSKHPMVDVVVDRGFVEESRFQEMVRPIEMSEPEAGLPEGIFLRRLNTPTEARLWLSISQRCFSRHFGYQEQSMADVARQLSENDIMENGEFWLAMLGERPLGMLRIRLGDMGEGYVEEVGVDPEVRGYGLGRALMEHGHKRLSDSGAIKSRLAMVYTNEQALPLYDSMGYTTSGTLILFKKKLDV